MYKIRVKKNILLCNITDKFRGEVHLRIFLNKQNGLAECIQNDRTLKRRVFSAIKGWEKIGCPALFPKKRRD